MNKEDAIKKQLQGLGAVFVGLLFFGESFLIGKMPRDIKSTKSRITTLQDEKRSLDSLQSSLRTLEAELEENRPNFERLFEKFTSDESTQNQINSTITKLTSSIIVMSDRLKPVNRFDYVSSDEIMTTVPKVSTSDPEMAVDRTVGVAAYESEIQMRCNYFELLQFLHEVGNQDIFFTPMDIEILPDPDAPYGVTAKTRLLTFGFEGMKPDKI